MPVEGRLKLAGAAARPPALLLLLPLLARAVPDLPDRPEPPQLLRASSTSLTVGWRAVADAGERVLGFALDAAEDGGPWRVVYDPLLMGDGDIRTADARSFTLTRLRPGSAYRFRVTSVNPSGRSAPSAAAAFRTASIQPTISRATPASGPVHGGTLVMLRGADLAFGQIFKCRFGDAATGQVWMW